MSIIAYETYRDVIHLKLQENVKVRGYRSRLAEALKIQKSYFSQVMSGTADLTPDQAANLADFWLLDKRESEYLISLVNLERAATPSLKAKIQARIEELRTRGQDMAPMVATGFELEIKHAMKFCSKWYYIFVQSALYVDQLDTAEALSARLDIPVNQVELILGELETMGLVERSGNMWKSASSGHYLKDLPLRAMLMREIRSKAMDDFASGSSDGIHHSSVGTISRQRYLELKEFLGNAIDEVESGMAEIEEGDEVMAVNVDMFRVGRSRRP